MKYLLGKIMIIVMLATLVIGCADKSEKQEVNVDLIEANQHLENNSKDALMNKFKLKVPNATMHNNEMLDIDGNEVKELVVIYDTPEKKANFAIVATDYYSSIELGDGDEYSFTYVLDSLKVVEKKFIITLHDKSKKFTVDYEMSMEYDKEKEAKILKIKSFNER